MTNHIEAPPVSLLTHIALPVRSIAEMTAFYQRYTTMKVISERTDDETGLGTIWLANERDITPAGARFVIVLIEGEIPRHVVGDALEERHGFLTSFSHLGFSLNSRAEVDRVAELADREGCLVLGPMYRNEVVGYICLIRDPDGNNIEFSVEQVLG